MAVTKLSNSGIKTGVLKYDSMLAGNPAYDPAATWLIQRVAGTGSSGTITFSSIPQTYQHLQIRFMAKTTLTVSAGYTPIIRLNGSSSSIYAEHFLTGDGSTAQASAGNSPSSTSVQLWRAMAGSKASSPTMTNIMAVCVIDIHDYASTTKNKTIRYSAGLETNFAGTESWVTLGSGLYAATSAVSSIDITTNGGGSFTTASSFALYGFKG